MWMYFHHERKKLSHKNPHTFSRPQYAQTTHPQTKKRNST